MGTKEDGKIGPAYILEKRKMKKGIKLLGLLRVITGAWEKLGSNSGRRGNEGRGEKFDTS